jgi:hypothetical protein
LLSSDSVPGTGQDLQKTQVPEQLQLNKSTGRAKIRFQVKTSRKKKITRASTIYPAVAWAKRMQWRLAFSPALFQFDQNGTKAPRLKLFDKWWSWNPRNRIFQSHHE